MIPLELASIITIAALVGLGIFIYPWMLQKRWGATVVALVTVALAVLYFFFDRGRSSPVVAMAFGALWALAPVVAAWVTGRTRGPSKK